MPDPRPHQRPDAEELDDHDRLVIVEARLDLVDERLAAPTAPPSRPPLDPVSQRHRDTLVGLVAVWTVFAAVAGAVLWRFSEAIEGVLS